MPTPRLGRQAEFDRIDDAIAAALNGERRLVVVVGDAASGRTRLLEDVASQAAERGASIAAAQGHQAEASEIGRIAEALGLGEGGEPATVLVVDDAQWADPTSIGLLQQALATTDAGITIVLGHEPTSGAQALALDRLKDAGNRSGDVEELVLEPLTSAELRAVTDAGVAERITALTGGTYDDVNRLVTDWVESGVLAWSDGHLNAVGSLPETWTGSDGRRPEELDDPARKLLEAVSIAGRPLPLEVAADLLGTSADETLGVGERLVDQGLLVQSREGFSPLSAIDASRIAVGLGAVRTSHLNAELAKAFTEAGYAERSPGLVGGYYLEAGDAGRAIPLLEEALTAAIEKGAAAEALPFIDAALAAMEEEGIGSSELEGRLRLERAKYYQTAGWTDRAAQDLLVALKYLEGAARVDALGFLAAGEDNRQQSQTAEVYAAAAIGEATAIGEPAKAGSLLLLQARILQRIGFPIETDASLARGSAILDESGNPFQRFLASENTGRIALDRGKAVEAEPLLDRAYNRAEEVAGLGKKADSAAWLARAQFMHGHARAGMDSVATALDLAEQTASSGVIFLGQMARSEGAGRFAAYEEALRAADEMLGYVLQQLPAWENAARYLRARALLGLDRADEAAEELEAALALCPEGINGWRWRLRIEAFRFNLLAATGAEWPKERAEDLTDELLQGQWLDIAAELMAVRAGIEDDEELARQGAGLALQLGIPTTAAAAIESAGLWSEPASAAVASLVKETARHVPDEWQEAWAAQPAIASALAAPDVVDEELAAAATALQAEMDTAMAAAGLADPDTTLSPAQRREQGLVRRRVRTTARWLALAAAVVGLSLIGGVVALALFAPDDTTTAGPTTVPTTTILALEATQLPLPEFFSGEYLTLGQNACRTGASDVTGVAEALGYYWRNDDAGDAYTSSPVVILQTVIAAQGRNVYFIDRKLNTSKIHTTDDVIIATIGGTKQGAQGSQAGSDASLWAYVATVGPYLYAYEADTGTFRWKYEIEPSGTPVVGVNADLSRAELYVGSRDGHVYAIHPHNNDEDSLPFWQWPAEGEPTGGAVTTDLTLTNDKLYFGVGEELIMLDTQTQQGLTCEIPSFGTFLTPVVEDGFVYAANSDGVVYVLEAGTCEYVDQLNANLGGSLKSIPAVHRGVVYQTIDTGVIALRAGTGVIWAWPAAGSEEFATTNFSGSATVANGMVYLAGTDGALYAIKAEADMNAADRLVWRWDEGGARIAGAATVTNGTVYIATRDGTIVAIGGTPGQSVSTWSCPTTGIPSQGTSGGGGTNIE
jgi:outer membrane protein assembly factor BamB/tetratricopeptide (TPR) repeat protein